MRDPNIKTDESKYQTISLVVLIGVRTLFVFSHVVQTRQALLNYSNASVNVCHSHTMKQSLSSSCYRMS